MWPVFYEEDLWGRHQLKPVGLRAMGVHVNLSSLKLCKFLCPPKWVQLACQHVQMPLKGVVFLISNSMAACGSLSNSTLWRTVSTSLIHLNQIQNMADQRLAPSFSPLPAGVASKVVIILVPIHPTLAGVEIQPQICTPMVTWNRCGVTLPAAALMSDICFHLEPIAISNYCLQSNIRGGMYINEFTTMRVWQKETNTMTNHFN